MKTHLLLTMLAMALIFTLEFLALRMGIDNLTLSFTIGVLAGLGGYEAKFIGEFLKRRFHGK